MLKINEISKAIKTQVKSLMPVELDKECDKALKIMKSFVFPEFNEKNNIPHQILKDAKGLAILSVGRIGISFSVKGGSGILISRLPDGNWSAPSAIKIGGVGFGSQFGAEIVELVMVLNTEEAVKNFSQKDNITLGGNLSVAAGKYGRNTEGGTTLNSIAAIYSYSRSKGAYIGMSLEGAMIMQNEEANVKYYGPGVTTETILKGEIPRPGFAKPLYEALHDCEFPVVPATGSSSTIVPPPDLPPPAYVDQVSPPPYDGKVENKV